MDEDRPIESAADAFQQISDEFRVAILHELARAGVPLQFSELLSALDDPDSGRLNYHLDKLTGTYVAREDGGYRLTIQGAKVVSSILASRYFDVGAEYETSAEGECYRCGTEDLVLEQTGQQARVQCRSCGQRQFRKSVSTALWRHRDPEDVPAALDRIVWAELELAVAGVCEYCRSAMTPRVAENDWDAEDYVIRGFDVVAVYECELCTNWKISPHGLVAWLHPEVRSFHRDHGIDPGEVTCWQIDQAMDARYTTVLAEDPYEVEVRFPVDDAECRVTFDERNEVTGVVREWTD